MHIKEKQLQKIQRAYTIQQCSKHVSRKQKQSSKENYKHINIYTMISLQNGKIKTILFVDDKVITNNTQENFLLSIINFIS